MEHGDEKVGHWGFLRKSNVAASLNGVAAFAREEELEAIVEGWTGAEIKECCRKAYRLKVSLGDSARYIVPVSRSAADQIQALRKQASGRFLSASKPGVYEYEERPSAASGKRLIRTEVLTVSGKVGEA